MNTKQAFKKVWTLTGWEFRTTSCANSATDPALFVKQLNAFYAHFDKQDFSTECEELLRALPLPDPEEPSPFSVEDVRCQLRRCKLGKGRSRRHLSTGAEELRSRALTYL